jgi:hypothetical protein
MIVAIVALIAALGGTAVAGGLVTGKKAKNIANKQITKRAPKLKVGSAEKADNVLWAVVADPGLGGVATLARSSGGVTVSDGTGVNVNFGRDVSQCSWNATKGDVATGVSPAGFAQTQQADGAAPNAVNVRTRDDAGTINEQDFHLVVVC